MSHPLVVDVRRDGCDVYVGRPSKWGNPFKIGKHGNREDVLTAYRIYMGANRELMEAARAELRGKILGCYCAPRACHADVLAEIANA